MRRVLRGTFPLLSLVACIAVFKLPSLLYLLFPLLVTVSIVGKQKREEEKRERLGWWVLVAVFVGAVGASLLLYHNTLEGGFPEDDDWRFLMTAQRLVNSQSTGEFLRWLFWSHEPWPQVRVGAYPSWTLNYLLFGTNPLPYRLTNILLHCVNVTLVVLLSYLLRGSVLGAVGAGSVFCVFPLASESVTLFYGINDIICALFFLTGSIAFVEWRRGKRTYWLVILSALGAIFTKEYGFVFPVLLFFLDVLMFREMLSFKVVARAYAPLFGVIALNLGWRAVMYLMNPGAFQFGMGRGVLSVEPLASARNLLVRLPRVLCAPMDGRLAGELLPGSLELWKRTFSIVAILFLMGLWRLRSPKTRVLAVALAFVVLPAVMVHNALADIEALERARYLYISTVGFSLLMGWVALGSRVHIPVFLSLIALYGAVALQNNIKRVYEARVAKLTMREVQAIDRRYGAGRFVVIDRFRDRPAYNVVFPVGFDRSPLFERYAFEGVLGVREEDVRFPLDGFEFGELGDATHIFRWNERTKELEEVTEKVRELVSMRRVGKALPRLIYVGEEGLLHYWEAEEEIDTLAISEIEVEVEFAEPPHPPVPEQRPGKYWKESTVSLVWEEDGELFPVSVRAVPGRRKYRLPVRNSLHWLERGRVRRLGAFVSFASYPGVEEHYRIPSRVNSLRLIPYK